MSHAPVRLHRIDQPGPAHLAFLGQGLVEEEAAKGNASPYRPLAVLAEDAASERIGGISGFLYLGCLFIDQLYMTPARRGEGLGADLVRALETAAIEHGARIATVNTLDDRARRFYERLGYQVEFSRTGYDGGRVMHHLGRRLEQAAVISLAQSKK